jgi:hypothetical protein
MKPVLMVRDEDWIEAGRVGDTLEREGIPTRLCAIDRGDMVPAKPDEYAGLVLLGGTMSVSDYRPHQAFAMGDLVATAAHVEVTADLLRRWIDIYGDDLDPVSETVQPPERVLDDVERRVGDMQRNVTDPIYERWLRPVRERAAS